MVVTPSNIQSVLATLDLSYDNLLSKPVDDIFAEIRTAYKKQSLAYHPDKNKAPDAEAKFKAIAEAYEGLAAAHEQQTLAACFTNSTLSPAASTPAPATPVKEPKQQSFHLTKKMQDSLYDYYIVRHKSLNKFKDEKGHDTIRRVIIGILNVSAFSFKAVPRSDKNGYTLTSPSLSVLLTIEDFVTTVERHASTKTKLLTDDSDSASAALIIRQTQIQVGFVLDVTGSMDSMLSAAKQSLRSIGAAIEQDLQSTPDMTVITYHDYADEGAALTSSSSYGSRRGEATRGEATRGEATRGEASRGEEARGAQTSSLFNIGNLFNFSGRSADNSSSTTPKKLDALNYPGKREQDKLPVFTDSSTVCNMLDAVQAEGGGDTPEMVEAALAVATQLKWTAPVRTLYMAFDAPPHHHYEGAARDDFATENLIKTAQSKLTNDPCLKQAQAPHDWMTQVLSLTRQGVKINPMICTDTPSVLFLATFIACVSGGEAMLIKHNQWNDLHTIVTTSTQIDYQEASATQTLATVQNNMRPSTRYYQAVKKILDMIKLDDLFSDKVSLVELAAQVRPVYTAEIIAFLNAPTQTHTTSTAIETMPDFSSFRERVLASRRPVPSELLVQEVTFTPMSGTHCLVPVNSGSGRQLGNLFARSDIAVQTPFPVKIQDEDFSLFKSDSQTLTLSKGPNTPGVQVKLIGDSYRVCNNLTADSQDNKKEVFQELRIKLDTLLQGIPAPAAPRNQGLLSLFN